MNKDEQAIDAAARALSDHCADICGINRDANWEVHGTYYLEDVRVVIDAYKAKLETKE